MIDFQTISQAIATLYLIFAFGLTIWSLYYNKQQADVKRLTEQIVKELKEIKVLLKK